jgi:hypothetical protein
VSTIRFQLLTCGVEIAVDDPAVRAALRYLVQDVAQDVRPHAGVRYEVLGRPGGFSVLEDGTEVGPCADADAVMHLIYHRAHEVAHRSLPPHVRVHAGCATIAGRRVVFVGSKEAGKTTLMLRLAHDGVEVHGDELVLITADGRSLPYPRRFHVRPATFPLIPEMAGREGEFPYTWTVGGRRLYSVSPSDFGRPWRLGPGPVDAIIHVKPNHGRETGVTEILPEAALKRLRRHVTFPERSIHWLTTLFGVVKQARNLVLINGSPVEAAAVVKHLWDGSYRPGGGRR